MERESEFYYTGESYEDKPKPGKSFLIVVHSALGGSLLLTFIGIYFKGQYDSESMVALIITTLIVALVYWMVFSVAYGTVYKIGPDLLEIQSGIAKKKIRYSRIQNLVFVPSWRQIIKYGIGYQSFCNRFGNYVMLELKRDKIFLSPSNPDIFMEHIRIMLPEKNVRE